jgi:pimeloyl-ACP methyl ester carboxylesterase
MPAERRVALFIPDRPVRVLVLAHGFPWMDGSQSDDFLAEYAQSAVTRWTAFADAHRAVIVAPAFGGSDFGGYRALFGRKVDADEFVNAVVDEVAAEHVPDFAGRFSLHGHSAGAQFAARYLVAHPERLDAVVLSAPSAYPYPDPAQPWPDGMAPVIRDDLSGSAADGKAPDRVAGAVFVPRAAGWLTAASQVRVSVLVGSLDTEPRPAEPGQYGSSRLERAAGWITAMHLYARANGHVPSIRLVCAAGLDHDEAAMALPAQQIFAGNWAPGQQAPVS